MLYSFLYWWCKNAFVITGKSEVVKDYLIMILSSYQVLYEPAASGHRLEYPLQTAVPQRLNCDPTYGPDGNIASTAPGAQVADHSGVWLQIWAEWQDVYHPNDQYTEMSAQLPQVLLSLSASYVVSRTPLYATRLLSA